MSTHLVQEVNHLLEKPVPNLHLPVYHGPLCSGRVLSPVTKSTRNQPLVGGVE